MVKETRSRGRKDVSEEEMMEGKQVEGGGKKQGRGLRVSGLQETVRRPWRDSGEGDE